MNGAWTVRMKESDIRPSGIFDEYLRLSRNDAETLFKNGRRAKIHCPACSSDLSKLEFAKYGFDYVSCLECNSLYVSPRPSKKALDEFYDASESSHFWAERFFPAVAESRRTRIFRPRVTKLSELCKAKGLSPKVVMDIGAGYGIFLEEWKKLFPYTRTIAVEPSARLAKICSKKGLEVIKTTAEDVDGYGGMADLVVCSEVLEHVHDPLEFLWSLRSFVRTGGHLMVTTLGVDGFDIQVLWDRSKSVSPPHHINFLSLDGMVKLFERAGLKDVEILTPGLLDVNIVKNAFESSPALMEGNRFIQKIISDEQTANNFQNFLIDNRLSSHTWIFARK